MSDAQLLFIAVCCMCGVSYWMVEWAKANPIHIDFEDTEFPNEEDE